jgi:Rps23 Pro-64 3,4-dihydroxylase Tpa1-like proline 4-hydroxylase
MSVSQNQISKTEVFLFDSVFSSSVLSEIIVVAKQAKTKLRKVGVNSGIFKTVDNFDGYFYEYLSDRKNLINLFQNTILEYSNKLNLDIQLTNNELLNTTKNMFSINCMYDKSFVPLHLDNLKDSNGRELKKFYKLVYFFWEDEKPFDGGNITFWDRYIDKEGNYLEDEYPDSGSVVEIKNNMAIIFDATAPHQAEEIIALKEKASLDFLAYLFY